MKLYDFQCNQCGRKFEDLVQELADARCPGCASNDVAKQLSAFAVGGKSGGGADLLPSGGCGGGFCGSGGCG
jgi:putative FmdB family regulatory protein